MADGNSTIGETDETNNTTSLSIDIEAPPLPDLAPTSLSASPNPVAGGDLTVNVSVRNWGPGDAGASTTYFYLSQDVVIDAGDTLLGTTPTGPLAASAVEAESEQFTLPGDISGPYYVIVAADGDDVLVEDSESNNLGWLLIDVAVPQPDLIVQGLAVSDAAPTAGDTITVDVTALNQGDGDAGASTTYFYLSDDAVIDAGDTLLGTAATGALAAGGSEAESEQFTLAGDLSGTYYIGALADGGATVGESDENNNTASLQITVDPAPVAFAPSDIAGLVQWLDAADAATVTDQGSDGDVDNWADKSGQGNDGLGLAGGRDPQLDPGGFNGLDAIDFDGNNDVLHVADTPDLNNGSTFDGRTISIAFETSGDVDSRQVLYKSGGDAKGLSIYIVGGSLYMNGWQLSGTSWGPAWINTAVEANTAYVATMNFDAGVALLDGTISGSLNGVSFGSVGGVDTLGSHGQDIGVGGMKQHARFHDTYVTGEGLAFDGKLGEIVQYDHALSGSDQADVETYLIDKWIGEPPPPPDLIAQGLSVSDITPTAGDTVTVDVTVENQGAGDAGASTTYFYLSDDAVIDAGDTLLGTAATGALTSGGSEAESEQVVLPGNISGTYYIGAMADGTDAVGESDETNNAAAVSIDVAAAPLPDLIAQGLSVSDANPTAGDAITVDMSVLNQGPGAAGASTTYFYLSDDAVIDATDTLLGTAATGSLTSGGSEAESEQFTLSSFLSGTYYVGALADGGSVVGESDENNNTASLQITVDPAPVAFAPSDIAGLVQWLDAADAATVTDNGSYGDVDNWADKSGQGNDGQGLAGGRDPQLAAASFNGLDAIDFDGNNDVLHVVDTPDLNNGASFDGRTISIAFETSGDVDSRQVLYESGGDAKGLSIYIVGGSLYMNGWQLSGTTWGPSWVDTAVEANTAYVATMNFDAGVALLDGTITGSLNGVSFGSVGGVDTLGSHGQDIGVGGMKQHARFHDTYVTGEGLAFDGKIGEIVQYDHSLDAGDQGDVETYLLNKWLPPNQAPLAMDDGPIQTVDGAAVVIDVLANDSDNEDGQPTLLGIHSQGSHGVAVANPDGTITYTPDDPAYDGSDSFVYDVIDSEGETARATVTIDAFITPATFSAPNDLPGLIQWLDVADSATVTDNGADGDVDSVSDKSAHANHALGLGGGQDPMLAVAGFNGLDALDFDGVDDVMQVADSQVLNTGGPYTGRTVAIAFKTGDDIGTRQVIFEQGGLDAGFNVVLDGALLVLTASTQSGPPSHWGPAWIRNTWSLSENTPYVVTLTLDSEAETMHATLDGVSLGTYINPIGHLWTDDSDIGLGAMLDDMRYYGSSGELTGDGHAFGGQIGEVVQYDRALDVGERVTLENYLMDKWLPGGTPPNGLPVANDDGPVLVSGDVSVDIAALDNDTDAEDGQPTLVGIVSQGTHGTAVINPDSTFTYTLTDPAYDGADSFVYEVTDSDGATAQATVDIIAHPPSTFSPADMVGLVHWLDASDAATVIDTGSDGDIDLWDDKSSRNNDAFGLAGGQDPVLVPGGLNGRDTIAFDGVDDVLQVADTEDLNQESISVARTIAVAFETGSDVSSRQVIYEEGGANAGLNLYLDCGKLYVHGWNTTDGSWALNVSADVSGDTAYVAMLNYDALGEGEFGGTLNGASMGSRTMNDWLLAHSGDIGIGKMLDASRFHDGTDTGDGHAFGGEIGELVQFDRALNTAERSMLENYLMEKGLPGGANPSVLSIALEPATQDAQEEALADLPGTDLANYSTTQTDNPLTLTIDPLLAG